MKKYIIEKFRAESINQIKNHVMAEGIDRLVVNQIPLHCAIHKIDVQSPPQDYSLTHSHSAEDELNIILNDQDHDLLYRFVINDEEIELSAPASVWVPAGISHNANVIKGRGTFICMRFPKNSLGSAQPDPALLT